MTATTNIQSLMQVPAPLPLLPGRTTYTIFGDSSGNYYAWADPNSGLANVSASTDFGSVFNTVMANMQASGVLEVKPLKPLGTFYYASTTPQIPNPSDNSAQGLYILGAGAGGAGSNRGPATGIAVKNGASVAGLLSFAQQSTTFAHQIVVEGLHFWDNGQTLATSNIAGGAAKKCLVNMFNSVLNTGLLDFRNCTFECTGSSNDYGLVCDGFVNTTLYQIECTGGQGRFSGGDVQQGGAINSTFHDGMDVHGQSWTLWRCNTHNQGANANINITSNSTTNDFFDLYLDHTYMDSGGGFTAPMFSNNSNKNAKVYFNGGYVTMGTNQPSMFGPPPNPGGGQRGWTIILDGPQIQAGFNNQSILDPTDTFSTIVVRSLSPANATANKFRLNNGYTSGSPNGYGAELQSLTNTSSLNPFNRYVATPDSTNYIATYSCEIKVSLNIKAISGNGASLGIGISYTDWQGNIMTNEAMTFALRGSPTFNTAFGYPGRFDSISHGVLMCAPNSNVSLQTNPTNIASATYDIVSQIIPIS